MAPVAQTDRVLELLYDRQGFWLLDELAAGASLIRKRLDAALEELDQGGHRLEFSPAHGVRLVRPARLNAHLIERNLGTARAGRSAICFDEVKSTNDVAMASARQGGTDGLAVLAEFQRRGRGRHGRTWASRPGANVLLSVLLLEAEQSPLTHEVLTIAAGLAVAEGIEAACPLPARLKWPNDVLLYGEKIAGLLVETRREGPGRALVVGIGINANASPPPEQLRRPATDLAAHCGAAVERTEVVRGVLRSLDRWVTALSGQGSQEAVESLHRAWLARCGMINERVTVLCAGQTYVGRVLDVHPVGGLVLTCDDGRRVRLPAESSTVA